MGTQLPGGWEVKEAKLKGFNHYTHTVTGTGAWAGYQIAIGPHERPGWRKVRLMIGSAPLWRHACHDGNAYTAARETIDYLRGQMWMEPPPESEIIPRRVDVCIDHWGKRWCIEDLGRFACRQKGRGMAVGGDVIERPHGDQWVYRAPGGTTFYLGRRGAAARFLRIYDKTAEAAKTGKLPWLEPIWRAEGWDGESTVWRAEIEHGGDWLNGHGFKSMEDLKGCEAGLWHCYFGDVRHTVKRGGRLDRRETSRVWKAFGRAAAASPIGTWQWKPRPVKPSTDAAALLKQGAGCILSAEQLLSDSYLRDAEGGATFDASQAGPVLRRHATLSMIDDLMTALAKQRAEIECNSSQGQYKPSHQGSQSCQPPPPPPQMQTPHQ